MTFPFLKAVFLLNFLSLSSTAFSSFFSTGFSNVHLLQGKKCDWKLEFFVLCSVLNDKVKCCHIQMFSENNFPQNLKSDKSIFKISVKLKMERKSQMAFNISSDGPQCTSPNGLKYFQKLMKKNSPEFSLD